MILKNKKLTNKLTEVRNPNPDRELHELHLSATTTEPIGETSALERTKLEVYKSCRLRTGRGGLTVTKNIAWR
jgi:hypothetical protein